MGMDVFGQDPTDAKGEYFRNNVWWWRPLAAYIEETHPEIAAHCTHWHSNDGDGLNAEQSKSLAEKLRQDIISGRVSNYKNANHSHEFEQTKIETWYQFSEENVKEFADFLEHCGGFKIC